MSKVKVGVAGYGVIGNRLAAGVAKQEDMELVGVADVAPTLPVRALKERGMPFKLFTAYDGAEVAPTGANCQAALVAAAIANHDADAGGVVVCRLKVQRSAVDTITVTHTNISTDDALAQERLVGTLL